MRPLYAFLLLLLLSCPLVGRAQQPFERFGVKIKMLTLSNGRYPEFFANDSLRRIGSVVYNARLHRIAYLLPSDSLVGRVKPEITSRWFSPDPLAEKYMYISPYTYVSDNPVNKADPDGRQEQDVILKGPQAQAAFQQLQASVASSLSLAIDANGKVSYTQANGPPTQGAQQLMQAVDDHTVTVNVNAVGVDQQQLPDGSAVVGGAFMGNSVNPADKSVQTNQTVVAPILQTMDTYFNKPGATMLHEVTESYAGGQLSQKAGVSSGSAGQPGSVYPAAHSAASPQSGPYQTRFFDRQGNPMSRQDANRSPGNVGKVERYVQEGNRPAQIIQTIK